MPEVSPKAWAALIAPRKVRAPSRCCSCHAPAPDWIWQPEGPKSGADRHVMFEWAGSHYRGFLALHVCEACKVKIESHQAVAFHYKTAWWTCMGDGAMVRAVTRAEAFTRAGWPAGIA